MKITELKKLLKGGEWNDVEFKKARSAVPKSAFETVSAFANTHGGQLVFGVSQQGEKFEITGVAKPDKVQNDFLSVLHADRKISHDVHVIEQRTDIGGKTVLIFRITENPRTRKPVYLDGDIRRTFLRKGSGDYKAQVQDIERMLRDAGSDRWDSQPFERVDIEEVFNPSSVRWYRNRFHAANDGFDPRQPDNDFLHDWGYLIKDAGRLLPTRASVMLFGSLRGVRNLIPRPAIDVQFLGYAMNDPIPETRWIDRFVSEENIIQSWLQIVAKYKFFMPKPFRDIDPVTLGRQDAPPGFRVFREAAVNLLIHQDYGDHSRKAVIKFFRNGIQFWNPGDVFGDDSRLFEPGEKEVRNPAIAMAMRRIAMCEQAGTGIRMMRDEWQKLGHPKPTYKNDRSWKAFEFFIPELDKEVDMASDLMKSMFEDAGRGGKQATYVARNVRDRSGANPPQVSDKYLTSTRQVPGKYSAGTRQAPDKYPASARQVTPQEHSVLHTAINTATRAELQQSAGLRNREHFVDSILKPLLKNGLLEMTIPDKPRSSKQQYRLTDKGRRVLSGIPGNARRRGYL